MVQFILEQVSLAGQGIFLAGCESNSMGVGSGDFRV